MKFLVLGLTGKRGCGKDTMASHLKSRYGFRVLTYTNDVLAPILKAKGKEVTRENLINLALELRKEYGKEILTQRICDLIKPSGLWAISGVRYPEEVAHLKKCFGGRFRLVYVGCGARKRYERVIKRGTKGEGRLTFAQFMAIEEKETEKVIGKTLKLADFSISNDGTISEFKRKIDALAGKLGLAKHT